MARARQRAGCFLDFDGTMATIVADYDGAVAYEGVPALLVRLVEVFATVAVVSGRPVDYLRRALGSIQGLHYAGIYGLEFASGAGEIATRSEALIYRHIIAASLAAASDAPGGIGIEPKGLSLGVHWRTAPQHEPWARNFVQEQAAQHGLEIAYGKMTAELRPPLPIDKGTVIDELLGPELVAACCFGDDLGDLPAFAALDRARARGVAAVNVAVSSPGVPDAVLEAAQVHVDGPAGAVALLAALAA